MHHVDPLSRIRLAAKRTIQFLHLASWMAEYCHDCGKRQPLVWWADDDLWERVMGTGKGGIACPSCFWTRALDKGMFLHWVPLTEEDLIARPHNDLRPVAQR